MEEENISRDIVSISMDIIMHAGNSRLAVTEALKAITDGDFAMVQEKLDEAKKEIKISHGLQTDIISESDDKYVGYSMIFAHAQDTLMTVYSELNMARQLTKIFSAYEKRIANLESAKG